MPTPSPMPPMTPPQKASPRILEWILIALVVIVIAGLGYLYFSLMQLRNSVASVKTEIKEVGQGVVKQENHLEPENEKSQTDRYVNEYYQFTVDFPSGTEYCLNDFCDNGVLDRDIQHFEITDAQLPGYDVRSKSSGYGQVNIAPIKNGLGMSAVDFAKRSLQLNRQYEKDANYVDEGEEVFAGEPAYAFTAIRKFEERGLSYTSAPDGQGMVQDDPTFYEKAGRGMLLGTPHRVVYLDHEGTFYRIMYPLENETAVGIINSFRFFYGQGDWHGTTQETMKSSDSRWNVTARYGQDESFDMEGPGYKTSIKGFALGFSPDAQLFAYTKHSVADGTSFIYVIDLKSGKERQVTKMELPHPRFPLTWEGHVMSWDFPGEARYHLDLDTSIVRDESLQ